MRPVYGVWNTSGKAKQKGKTVDERRKARAKEVYCCFRLPSLAFRLVSQRLPLVTRATDRPGTGWAGWLDRTQAIHQQIAIEGYHALVKIGDGADIAERCLSERSLSGQYLQVTKFT